MFFLSVDCIMYHLEAASMLTKVVCSRGFLEMPIGEEDVPKVAFAL